VYSLVQVLIDVVFPEQAKEYAIALTKATEAYRVPRYDIPTYLSNRPPQDQASVLQQINLSKGYTTDDVTLGSVAGTFTVQDDKNNQVNIPEGDYISISMEYVLHDWKKLTHSILHIGQCSCYFFTKKRIPCKHMFAVFAVHNEWTWDSLPKTVTNSTYMVLNTSQSPAAGCTTTAKQIDFPMSPSKQPLPAKSTSAQALKVARRHLHDLLHKCTSALYTCNSIGDLKEGATTVESLYRTLVGATDISQLPVVMKANAKRAPLQTEQVIFAIRLTRLWLVCSRYDACRIILPTNGYCTWFICFVLTLYLSVIGKS
jgi:hypothetical protein